MNWWADKLSDPGRTEPPRRTPPPPPAQHHATPPIQARRPVPSQLQTEHCPSCGSANYMAPPGSKKRCLECGWPIVQSGSGMGSVSDTGGAAKPAKQVSTGGYNPQTIVGKVE